jgi:putative Holliday junction resolvase
MAPNAKATRIAAIDYGMARIGLALSDERKIFASPLMVVAATKRMEQTVEQVLKAFLKHQEDNRYTLDEIVVGLPLLMSGKKGLLADEVNHFVELLRKATTIPIVLWDERLTTVQAERSLKEGGMSRKNRSKVVDRVSAAILLQSYLDSKSLMRESFDFH